MPTEERYFESIRCRKKEDPFFVSVEKGDKMHQNKGIFLCVGSLSCAIGILELIPLGRGPQTSGDRLLSDKRALLSIFNLHEA